MDIDNRIDTIINEIKFDLKKTSIEDENTGPKFIVKCCCDC